MKGKAPFISQALFPQFIASIVTLLFLKNKNLNYPGETMISPPLYSVPGTKPEPGTEYNMLTYLNL